MNNRRRMTGVVTSDKMMKTVVVEIARTYKHPLYKKVVHASSRFKAHNELDAQMGDVVVIVESRPLSRDKRWVVEKILRRQGEAAVTVMVVEDAVGPAAAEVAAEEATAEQATPAEAAVAQAAVAEVAVAEAPVAEAAVEEAAVAEAAVEEAAVEEAAEVETPEAETTEADTTEEDTTATDQVEGEQ